MLVITRKSGQTIVLDGDVRITVEIKNRTTARLLIDAPDHVKVMREELLSSDQKGECCGQEK